MTQHVTPPRMMDVEVGLPGHEGRKGYYMLTWSGGHYFPCDPREREIFIADIAHHLAMQCRFNGAVTRFYSVAEHCYHCSFEGPQDEALERLMHDAAEAYLGDLIRPLKKLPELFSAFGELEERNDRAIAARFGLTYPWPTSVKTADEAVCTLEMQHAILAEDKGVLHDNSRVSGRTLKFWDPLTARAKFIERFMELAGERLSPVY